MPNGYQVKKEEWDRMEKPLLAIDSEFESFAKLHALEVTKLSQLAFALPELE